jgi:hypothetical protein
MKKLLLGYRDNMRVEIESAVAVTAKTVGPTKRRKLNSSAFAPKTRPLKRERLPASA